MKRVRIGQEIPTAILPLNTLTNEFYSTNTTKYYPFEIVDYISC